MADLALGNPLGIPCPRCSAGREEACVVESTGRELPNPHIGRVRAAAKRAADAKRRAEGDAEERIATPRFRRVYAAARLELEHRSAFTPLAAEQLETVCLNMEAAEMARAKARSDPLVEGSTGQPVANPLIAVALRYDAQALATARALKLTPDTRGHGAPAVPDSSKDDTPATDSPLDELSRLDEVALKRKAKAARKHG